jgi:hypothetical protein
MTHCKPIYTDSRVIAIRKPRHLLSLERGPAAWHSLIGENTTRKLLRALLNKARTMDELLSICGDENKLRWYLALLEDGGIVARSGEAWTRGPEVQGIDNIGPTLEWYVAEWFRSELHAPARHGVAIKEVPRGGDLDVVAFVSDVRVFVECKTAKPSAISQNELRQFLQRAADFNPEIAVVLVDTESSVQPVADGINDIFADLARKETALRNPRQGQAGDITKGATISEQPEARGLYWGRRNIYTTRVRDGVDAALSAVLRLYYAHVRHLVYLWGRPEVKYDLLKGTVAWVDAAHVSSPG